MKFQPFVASICLFPVLFVPAYAQETQEEIVEQQAIVVTASDDGNGTSSIMSFEVSDANGSMILADSFDGNFDFSMGAAGNNFSMLNNTSVQQDLQLVDEQLDQIKQINKEFGEKIKDQMESLKDENGSFNFQNGPDLGQLIRDLKQQQQDQISSILLPEQQKRLDQVSRQMRIKQLGTAKALSGKIAKELGITSDQKKNLRTKAKELKKELDEKMAELRAKAKKELLNELTAEQREKLTDLLGDEFVQQPDEGRNKFRRLLRQDTDQKSGDF